MFKTIKIIIHRYKLINHTVAELFRLEEIIENCSNKKERTETYLKLIGVRLFFTELTGKSWKGQKTFLKASNFKVKHNTKKKT